MFGRTKFRLLIALIRRRRLKSERLFRRVRVINIGVKRRERSSKLNKFVFRNSKLMTVVVNLRLKPLLLKLSVLFSVLVIGILVGAFFLLRVPVKCFLIWQKNFLSVGKRSRNLKTLSVGRGDRFDICRFYILRDSHSSLVSGRFSVRLICRFNLGNYQITMLMAANNIVFCLKLRGTSAE